MTAPDPLTAALAEHFGFTTFHKGQRAVIEDVLAGRPTVAVMPTGAGKSLCYQLPALLLDGVTVVVSPLIALMKDQVDSLNARGVPADFVNSSQSREEQLAALDRLRAGETRLVYVAPERFRHAAFVRALAAARPALLAVDEAHCISRWGHDFRPDYIRLGQVVEQLRPPRLLACTATATPGVRDDILGTLGIPDASVHVAGFLRTNLFLDVRLCGGDKDRERRLAAFLKDGAGSEGSVIVYASTRKRVERFAQVCREAVGPRQVIQYHGGMTDEARKLSQDRFMGGEARVAVATNAFGMGVDRSDVRAVVHVDLPRTVEGYYQEVGRAGRDRDPSHCLLLYNPNDTRVHEFLINRSHPTAEATQIVWSTLRAADGPVPWQVLEMRLAEHEQEASVDACVRLLARVDAVQYDGGHQRAAPGAPEDVGQLGIDFADIERHRAHEFDQLRRMKRFVHTPGCRHAYVLDYFGERMDEPCPGCDRCRPSVEGAAPGVVFEPPGEDEALVIRKALAGVARAEGRFGVKKVALMLAGSAAREIQRTSLRQLSTFGLLKQLGPDRCAELIQLLIDQDLCRLAGGDYPLVQITREGWEIMQGREAPAFRPPPHLVPGGLVGRRAAMLRGDDADEAEEPEDAVVTALRTFRSEEAARRSVPPYVIFSDRTMVDIAIARPATRDEFLNVRGLGPTRWEQFGERLLAAIAEAD